MTKKTVLWIGVPSLALFLALLLISAAYVSPAPAVASEQPIGTFAIGGGGGAAYLINTRTGEVWALSGSVKQPISEIKSPSGR